ncbi:MAG: hypothetical protein ACT4OP_02250 [Actinomycetota bacterium]
MAVQRWWSRRSVWWLGAIGTASIVILIPPVLSLGSVPSFAYLIASVLWAPLGLILWRRMPDHPMGPLITATGVASIGVLPGLFMGNFFERLDAVVEPQAWMMLSSLGVAGIYYWLQVLSILLFPEGRPQTWQRRWLVRLILIFMGGATVAGLLAEPLGPMQHPFVTGELAARARDVWLGFQNLFGLVLLVVIGLKIVDFRRAEADRKAQLKWLIFVLSFYLIATFWAFGVVGLENFTQWHLLVDATLLGLIGVAMTFAVLRYRLYEIDQLVSRTVTYALVVVIVAAVFALPVILLPTVIDTSNDLIIAVATLAAAAFFNFVRRRVQTRVDRRFNRAKYDADREVNSFVKSLGARNDSAYIGGATVELVDRIFQPAALWIWVKEKM